MALTFDPVKGQEAAETITGIMNGRSKEVIAEAYGIAQKIGEDNPIVEHLGVMFRDYQGFYNEQLVPAANKVHDNLVAYSEFAAMFNNLNVAKVDMHADVGTVKDNNYDAASQL